MTDPIADMLTRIRNAIAVNKNSVIVPFSKLRFAVAEQLAKSGFIAGVKKTHNEAGFAEIELKLSEEGANSPITKLERVSKPGRRNYAKAEELKPVLGGRGVLIISTSKGIMTDAQARKQKIGGEVMCKVY